MARRPQREKSRALNDYDLLSIRDLIIARDLYHVLLMKHPNVMATAIGRYRIRTKDSWPDKNGDGKIHGKYARTLQNSQVRYYSWPSILVFVTNWQTPEELAEDPGALVPKTLFLPDGRGVPVCIIEAERESAVTDPPLEIAYPTNNIGGGWPVLASVQGRQYAATISCLVTDGHKTYGLTNNHVTGEAGEVLYSRLGGKLERIGVSANKHATRELFETIYPGWPGRDTYVNLDIGLIELDDINKWTTKIRTIGEADRMADLSVNTITLKLIGNAVTGVGAASGQMHGEIAALFYRYKTNGGFEYVADALIGPRPLPSGKAIPLATHPGDSGTLWMAVHKVPTKSEQRKPRGKVKPELTYQPLAMQWGRNILNSAGPSQRQSYVLATFLSRVCATIGVDPIRNWNMDQTDTWGAVGHFSIASRVTKALSNRHPRLVRLFELNRGIISHNDDALLQGEKRFTGMGSQKFVALADVPDFYWKTGLSKQGFARYWEKPNHFADMDQPNDAGKTLLDLTKRDDFIDPDKWVKFYDSITDLGSGEKIQRVHRGLLPFRVWQIFDAMVGYAKKGDDERFVCCGGVLTHYIGDSCQPLHISYLHDGYPDTKSGKGVHKGYEDDMLENGISDILDGIDRSPKVRASEIIGTGFEAAKLTISLMRRTFASIPPADIVDAYVAAAGGPKPKAKELWNQFGDKTIGCMQDGVHTLAVLWESAWETGGGDRNMPAAKALTQSRAMKICQDKDKFIPSLPIDQIGAVLKR